MQPPPRKVKPAVQLKNIHSEQASKLQQKHQQESDLLEDIRLFSKQRSIIEKEYAQALCKVAQQFLSKRQFPTPPTLGSDNDTEYKTVMQVWKTVLERTETVGKTRLQAADTYLQQISEPVKPIKVSKTQMAKKVFDQVNTLHKEVAVSVADMVKSHKVYSEEEHIAHEARDKAMQMEEKVKNKSTGIFTSLATLQQKCAKLNTRREQCETKSTASRNEYILNQSAANAHQVRYYQTDLSQLLQMLDCEMYEKVKGFFTTLSRTELECCGLTQECFTKIMSDSTMISREYNLQCFLHENLVFTNLVQYDFDAQDSDPVRTVVGEHGATHVLDKEARKWATRIAKENKVIKDSSRTLQQMQDQHGSADKKSSSSKEDSAPASPVDPEIKMEELRQCIRKAETGKVKAEARLEALRKAGVNVEEWLNSANAEALAVEEEEAAMVHQRSPSNASVKTEGSAQSRTESANEDVDGGQLNSSSTVPNDSTYINYEEDDYEETFDSTGHSLPSVGPNTGRLYPMNCTALYNFPASNADELSLRENETLELIADGDGDGWVKARNEDGDVGFIPENYIQLSEHSNGVSVDANEINVDQDSSTAGYDSAPQSAGYDSAPQSAGYDSAPQSAGYDSAPQSAGYDSAPQTTSYDSSAPASAGLDSRPSSIGQSAERTSRTSAYSATDFEVQQAVMGNAQTPTEPGLWARALYDYDATCDEELSFQEGQLIRIIRKDENGVDDGWWEGEINSQVGVFPSLVVEEILPDQVFTADAKVKRKTLTEEQSTGDDDLPPPPPEVLDPTTSDVERQVTGDACTESRSATGQDSITTVTVQVHAASDTSHPASKVAEQEQSEDKEKTAQGSKKNEKAVTMQAAAVVAGDDVPFADDDNEESVV